MLSERRLLTLIATLGTGLALVTSPGAAPASNVAIRLEPGTWPTYVASGFGSIWVASHRPSAHGPLLYRIDPRTNRIVARLRLPDNACWHPAVGAGYLWVSACGGEVANPVVFKVKVGRRGMKVVGRVRGENPVFGDGSLWVQNPRADRVLRVDPRSGLVLARIDPRFDVTQGWAVGGFGYRSIWAHSNTVVTRIDVATNKATAVIPLPGARANTEPGNFGGNQEGFTAGKVWLPNIVGLFEINPATDRAKLLRMSMHAFTQWGDDGIGTTAHSVFVRRSDTVVSQIDAATGKIKANYPAGGHGGDLGVAFRSLWVAATDLDSIWREPLR